MNAAAIELAETLRTALPSLRLQLNCGGGKMNSQLKKAFNSGASYALVVEADEQGLLDQVKLRQLGDESSTEQVPVQELLSKLKLLYPNA
jgi:histidyl-tRNA synthetase